MNAKTQPGLFSVPSEATDVTLTERRTPELILAFVGPVGSGVTTTASMFANILESNFGYRTYIHKLSSIIERNAHLVNKSHDPNAVGFQRIKNLQDIGNCLRKTYGSSYITERLVEKIATTRLEEGYDKTQEPFLPLPLRHVHIIDSLKNPDEAHLLRDIYEDTFWLVGVFAPTEVRKDRLRSSGLIDTEIQSLIVRDEKENFAYGQNVRDTIFDADFFVRNDQQNDEKLEERVARFLDILFNISVNSPTMDEAAMYTAVSAATTSACMSRQVGAAIYSQQGELLGIGSNDVPKFGGGLYRHEDEGNDHRCYKWGGKICHNDDRKEKLYQRVAEMLKKDGIIKNPNLDTIRKALKKNRNKRSD